MQVPQQPGQTGGSQQPSRPTQQGSQTNRPGVQPNQPGSPQYPGSNSNQYQKPGSEFTEPAARPQKPSSTGSTSQPVHTGPSNTYPGSNLELHLPGPAVQVELPGSQFVAGGSIGPSIPTQSSQSENQNEGQSLGNNYPVPGSPGTAIGVYPPSHLTTPYPNYPNYDISISKYPFFIIPFPVQLPNLPSPTACPCYLVNSNNSNSLGEQASTQPSINQANGPFPQFPIGGLPPGINLQAVAGLNLQQQPGSQQGGQLLNQQLNFMPYGILGFIPVIFFPYCPGASNFNFSQIQPQLPAALPFPYPCSQCQQNSASARSANDDYNGVVTPHPNSFQNVLSIVDPTGSAIVKSPNRRRARKMRTLKERQQSIIENVSESNGRAIPLL